MNKKFSPEVKRIIQKSREEAIRLGNDSIGTEHLLLGIITEASGVTAQVLKS
jgi:ATP-dependent Clp protease ATP-binding subunit ClpC